MDKDINFLNQAFDYKLGFPNEVEISNTTGLVTNKFSPGTALFWIPGFILGQGISHVGNYVFNLIIGYDVFLTNGNGVLPQYFVAISSVLFSTLGLWFILKFLQDWFNKKTSALAVFTIFLTTQVFYYTAMDPVNSHSVSFMLSSLLLYWLSRLLKSGVSWQKIIQMGIVAGLITLVRNQDVVVVLPILLAVLISKKDSFVNKLNWITLYLGSAFIIFSIQVFSTIKLFGVLASPYIIRGETFSWFKPAIFRVLFTLENGLFFFSPILLISVIFLFKNIYKNKAKILNLKKIHNNPLLILILVSLSSFLLQLYVVASWGPEIIGGPYGTRMFMSIVPHLSIGTALFINFLKKSFKTKQFLLLYLVLLIVFFVNMLMQTFWMLYRF